jgi:hypothetical protein
MHQPDQGGGYFPYKQCQNNIKQREHHRQQQKDLKIRCVTSKRAYPVSDESIADKKGHRRIMASTIGFPSGFTCPASIALPDNLRTIILLAELFPSTAEPLQKRKANTM